MKKTIILVTIVLSFAAFSLPALANTQTLGQCLVDSLNGKERKELAKWIYFAIAAHPEMNSFSNITNKDRDNIDKYIGKLVTRLLAEDCSLELKAAQNSDPMAIQKAFELVGQVAMQELMANEGVMTRITSYVKYLDEDKISSALTNE